MRRTRLLTATVPAAALALAALTGCGGSSGGSNDSAAASQPTATTPAATTPAAIPTNPPATGKDAIGGSVSTDLKSKPTITVPSGPAPSQLETKDIVEGNGKQATTSDTVTVQYLGVFYKDGKEFDSSWARGAQPVQFPLNQVITGFRDGIAGMKVGGRREIVVPPSAGYGAQDNGPIPGNSTLVFVVDLVSIP